MKPEPPFPRDFSLWEVINSACCLSRRESAPVFAGTLPRKCPTGGQEGAASLWEGGCPGHRPGLGPTPRTPRTPRLAWPCPAPRGGAQVGLALKIMLTSSLHDRFLVGGWRVGEAVSTLTRVPSLGCVLPAVRPPPVCAALWSQGPPDGRGCPLLRWEPSPPCGPPLGGVSASCGSSTLGSCKELPCATPLPSRLLRP